MSTSQNSLRALRAYVHAAAKSPRQRPRAAIMPGGPLASPPPRVLVVEFRDDVFGRLRSLLGDAGLAVERAESSWAVAGIVERFAPDLILINEQMPHESGWLVSAKLRFGRKPQPVWVYATQRSDYFANLKEFLGVDEVITYGGDLYRLLAEVRQRIARWQAEASASAPLAPVCCASSAAATMSPGRHVA